MLTLDMLILDMLILDMLILDMLILDSYLFQFSPIVVITTVEKPTNGLLGGRVCLTRESQDLCKKLVPEKLIYST